MPEERHSKMIREEAGRRGAEAKAEAENVPGLKDVDTEKYILSMI